MSYPRLSTSFSPATPQRPLPGAYQPTPVTTIRNGSHSFASRAVPTTVEQSASPGELPKLPPAASKNKMQNLSSEERAAETINDKLTHESRYPDLDSYLSRKLIAILLLFVELIESDKIS